METEEEYWIDATNMTDAEYDEFIGKVFRKVKKKVKEVQPIRSVLGIKKKPKTPPKPSPKQIAAIKAKQEEQAKAKAEQEKATEQVVEQAAIEAQLEMEAQDKIAAAEQAALEAQQGNTKKVMIIGLVGILGLAVIGGIIMAVKSKQNQLKALHLEGLEA